MEPERSVLCLGHFTNLVNKYNWICKMLWGCTEKLKAFHKIIHSLYYTTEGRQISADFSNMCLGKKVVYFSKHN